MLVERQLHQTSTTPTTISVVLLTWNEEHNITACLESLAHQTRLDFEVVIIDAASTDATARVVMDFAKTSPVPIRLHVASTRLRVGPARNMGVQFARSDTIAFLSADAEAEPPWIDQAVKAATRADVTFGRQIHAPTHVGVGAAVRGLRYHFPDTSTDDPKRYASNVNAVIRRPVLEAFPFGASIGESAVDDLLLAQRAAKAGLRIAYEPEMVVRHRDVSSARAELVKNVREGLGWGEHAAELGFHHTILAWGALLSLAIVALSFAPGIFSVYLLAASLWAPAFRRVLRRQPALRWPDRLVAFVVSPAFDLAFLAAYLRGLSSRRRTSKPKQIQEIPS